MVELIPYKAEHAIEVIANKARQPCLDVSDIIEKWAKLKEGPTSKTGVSDGKIIGCGGLEICWPGMAEGWIVLASEKYDFNPKVILLQMREWIEEHKLIRVQVPLRNDFPAGIRFAEFLGFKDENARLKKYHPDGTDALMYAIIGD